MEPDATWAEEEFGEADLGDVRRNARLVHLASVLGAQPSASLPDATDDPATLKAAYRFFANDYVRADAILASHIQSTKRRLQTVERVLALQDTTYLDWTSHPRTTGLGALASPSHQGLLAHTTLAITPERVPLGLLQQQVWARDNDLRRNQDHKQRPIEEKESQKWLSSLDCVIAARAECPATHFVSVGDREADVYDLFLLDRPSGVDLLIRAAQDRKAEHEEKYLWAVMATAPVAATVTIHIGARAGRAAREANLKIRWKQVRLRPPNSRAKEKLPSITVWAVWAVESSPPAGVEAVEWLLLTTVPISSTEDALSILEWYAARWSIEVWHKVLKSGCRIEERQLEAAERLIRCLALYSVIAWRILYATMLSRAAPELPCTVLLDEHEWQGLYCRIHRVAIAPAKPPTLRQAVRWIAQLGGFLGRKRDGEPGVSVLWKGFQHLVDIAAMYRIMHSPSPTPTRRTQNKDSG
jgi:transposase-like protein/transposase Tn5 family protein